MSDWIRIKREDLQAIFDLAVNSMDFGSGFWDTDEVNSARKIAELIGVDPMVATPYGFGREYRHPWVASPYLKPVRSDGSGAHPPIQVCKTCDQPQDWWAHGDGERP